MRVIDNGHTIQVNYAPGSRITVGSDTYELVQFHFHRPSEERIEGKAYAMVAHLVHRSVAGKLAVVGVLLESGAPNPLLETLWRHLPPAKELESARKDVTIDASHLLPADRGYYTFPGSLTTPPCTENVRWLVLKQPVRVSAEQIATFAQRYPNNARPVQPLNARVVQETLAP
ncbi:MAG TPA: carbonic anhydrase family protein [Burkholderiaceae bacterium]|nr:carbonic anhydrase family protein [Burkholderiaceae bacterium]